MVFYGIGIGPGDPELITLKAAEIIHSVPRIFYVSGQGNRESVSRMIVSSAGKGVDERLQGLRFSMKKSIDERRESWQKNATIIVESLKKHHECAFATIGDPMIYSTFINVLPPIKKILPELEVKVIPGITSFQAAAAEQIIPLAMDDEILTIVPAWKAPTLQRSAVSDSDTTVFLKAFKNCSSVLDFSRKNHTGEFLYASRIGLPDEKYVTEKMDSSEMLEEYLSLIISRKRKLNDGLG